MKENYISKIMKGHVKPVKQTRAAKNHNPDKYDIKQKREAYFCLNLCPHKDCLHGDCHELEDYINEGR
ncbi:MAG: hypothetical protein RSB20_01600 [Clostridia bacterium]